MKQSSLPSDAIISGKDHGGKNYSNNKKKMSSAKLEKSGDISVSVCDSVSEKSIPHQSASDMKSISNDTIVPDTQADNTAEETCYEASAESTKTSKEKEENSEKHMECEKDLAVKVDPAVVSSSIACDASTDVIKSSDEFQLNGKQRMECDNIASSKGPVDDCSDTVSFDEVSAENTETSEGKGSESSKESTSKAVGIKTSEEKEASSEEFIECEKDHASVSDTTANSSDATCDEVSSCDTETSENKEASSEHIVEKVGCKNHPSNTDSAACHPDSLPKHDPSPVTCDKDNGPICKKDVKCTVSPFAENDTSVTGNSEGKKAKCNTNSTDKSEKFAETTVDIQPSSDN